MRRAGGWALGAVVVAAMAGGGWVAFRPILNRETIIIQVNRGDRDPTSNAMISGMTFALAKAGNRAGGYRVNLQLDVFRPTLSNNPNSPLFVELGDSSLAKATAWVPNKKSGFVEKQVELRLLPELKAVGKAAAGWARETGSRRIAILYELDGKEDEKIGIEFREAAKDLTLSIETRFDWGVDRNPTLDRLITSNPDLVFYAGEKAPYGRAFELFSMLRKRGYTGRLMMADSDPEVSFLAVPTQVVDGTLLASMISPPSKEFAAAYEPATGRHAGPHAWPGYLLMKSLLELIERAGSNHPENLCAALEAQSPPLRSCALYAFKSGKWEFVQELK